MPDDPPKVVTEEQPRERLASLLDNISRIARNRFKKNLLPVEKQPLPPVDSRAGILKFLRFIPWILGGLFAFSFFWDFNGLVIQILGRELLILSDGEIANRLSLSWLTLSESFSGTQELNNLIRTTAASGLIGFLTNWIAVAMLFLPRDRRPVFGQGLIPGQRDRIVFRLAESIDAELINPEIISNSIKESDVINKFIEESQGFIKELIDDENFRGELRLVVKKYLTEILSADEFREKIADIIIKAAEGRNAERFGGQVRIWLVRQTEGHLRAKVDEVLLEASGRLDELFVHLDPLIDAIPKQIEDYSGTIEEWAEKVVQDLVKMIDVTDLLMKRMQEFDDRRLETLIQKSSNDQMNYIKYLGGILGFFGGFVIFNPWIALTGLISTLLALVGIDVTIHRLSPRYKAST